MNGSEKQDDRERLAVELLGPRGRMLARSKSGYRERLPEHAVVFNASVFADGVEIWVGDLDLTLDEPRLVQLAQQLGEELLLLLERDACPVGGGAPVLGRAVYRGRPDGSVSFSERFFIRSARGTLQRVSAR